ncbi:hypothetical protein [Veillonella sp. 3891]|uniref:hypothetical protein n=1 Tax=Veillonella sp. 3891 TaxID=2490951 RepID=UPI000F8DFBBC|nr:hypothetical protein [Veillonella sp. 3891]
MGTIKDYLQPSPIEKYFAHRDMWEKYFSINNRFVNQNVMTALEPLQIAMQPYLNMMSIAQSANNAMIANMSSLDRIATGFEQLQQIHKIMQPMVEYQAILNNIKLTLADTSITDFIVLNNDVKVFEDLSSFESNIQLSPAEEEVIDTIIKDEAYLNWFNKYVKICANKIQNVKKEDVAKWIFLCLLNRICSRLFDFMLDKII